MRICINVKVFELTIFCCLLIAVFCHDMMNMVAKIICFMRMEVGHWYYTVVF